MIRTRFYILAVALHLLVLFWFFPVSEVPPPPPEKKYVEVSLSSLPGPARLGPDSGPDDQAKSAAAPGAIVVDSPPPVSAITPLSSSLAPSPEPPPPNPVPPPPPPSPASTPTETRPPDNSFAPTSFSPLAANAGAPVSGSGKGNARQWSRGSGGNGHYYEAVYVPEGITWVDAQKFALLHDGYLATISSEEENNAVFYLVRDPKFWRFTVHGQYSGPWIGGCNFSDSWEWVNHEGPVKYSNWYPTEPEERPNGPAFYGLHYYSEGWTEAEVASVIARSNANNRGAGIAFQPPKIAAPEPLWDVALGSIKLNGFVVEYNSDPAKLSQNPRAAANFNIPANRLDPRAFRTNFAPPPPNNRR